MILDECMLKLRCRKVDATAFFWKLRWVEMPLDKIDHLWVGRVMDYERGVLLQAFESRGYGFENTLVLHLKSGAKYQVRDYSWLSDTGQLLDALRAQGITVRKAENCK
jgi:hypothetical protein